MKRVTRKVKAVTWRMGYIDTETGRASEHVITLCDGTDMTKQVGKVTADKGMCYSAAVASETEVLMSMDINDFVRFATVATEKNTDEEEDNE